MAARCVFEGGCRNQQSYGLFCKQHRAEGTPAKKRGRKPGQEYELGPRVRCILHKGKIPKAMPRYQFIRIEAGGREGRHNIRKVISTVCEPCWQARTNS